eukprot:6119410-Amphidinium_carterae.4
MAVGSILRRNLQDPLPSAWVLAAREMKDDNRANYRYRLQGGCDSSKQAQSGAENPVDATRLTYQQPTSWGTDRKRMQVLDAFGAFLSLRCFLSSDRPNSERRCLLYLGSSGSILLARGFSAQQNLGVDSFYAEARVPVDESVRELELPDPTHAALETAGTVNKVFMIGSHSCIMTEGRTRMACKDCKRYIPSYKGRWTDLGTLRACLRQSARDRLKHLNSKKRGALPAPPPGTLKKGREPGQRKKPRLEQRQEEIPPALVVL